MMRILYTLLFALLLPFIVLRLWIKGRKNPGYRARLAERFGVFVAPTQTGGIWVHAVSVGETLAALPLIEALLARYPHLPITVTTTTPTGSERVQAALGARVFHVYSPYDLPICVNAFLRRVKPRLCLIMETELWPTMLACNKNAGVKTMLINARLSRRSARGYRRFAWLTKPMLRDVDVIAAQQKNDAARLWRLGAASHTVHITGSIKSDVKTTNAQRDSGSLLREQLGRDRYVLIAASTHDGEESALLAAFQSLKKQLPHAVLIVVPRHPERFNAVFALAQASGLTVSRRTAHDASSHTDILVGDTMGELMCMYAAADVAFVGGSLIERGGHNLLEPAAWGIPLLQGPHTFNFAVLTQQFLKAQAVQIVENADQWAHRCTELADPVLRREWGQRAQAELERQRGALPRVLALIDQQLLH